MHATEPAKPSQTIKILVIDDDTEVFGPLKAYFSSTDDIEVLAFIDNVPEALESIKELQPDLVLSDIHMPHGGGIKIAKVLKEMETEIPFVAMTSFDADHTLLEVVNVGVAGYITKDAPPEEFFIAVREGVMGGTTISPGSLSRLLEFVPGMMSPAEKLQNITEKLTARQVKILGYLGKGLSNSEIAQNNFCSSATVKREIKRLMKLYKTDTRVELAIKAHKLS